MAVMEEAGFPGLLKTWRHRRRMSQLDLALSCGVSQRHLSFLESGRARPSRAMILQLSETLELPLRDRNDWLHAAGFAPVFKTRALDHPHMSQVMSAVRMLLANHAPFPALAIDRSWNILLANEPFERLSAMLGADLWSRVAASPGAPRNLMRLFFHPEGIRPIVANWDSVAPLLWRRAQREAEAAAGEDMQRALAELAPYVEFQTPWDEEAPALLPIMPLRLEKDGLTMSLFTIISAFGTVQDVTADELRIETLFPADEATELLLRGMAAG